MTLFIHDQVLPADHGEPVLVFAFLHAYDFVGLSACGLQQLDRYLATDLERVRIIHDDPVNLRDQKRVGLDHLQAF